MCWRDGDNPSFAPGTSVLSARLTRLKGTSATTDPAAPGPQSLGSPQRVHSVLADAGWGEVYMVPVDGVGNYSTGGSDGVEERLAMIVSTTTGIRARAELEPGLGPRGWAALLDDVCGELRRNLVDGVLQLAGRSWLVTATNPESSPK